MLLLKKIWPIKRNGTTFSLNHSLLSKQVKKKFFLFKFGGRKKSLLCFLPGPARLLFDFFFAHISSWLLSLIEKMKHPLGMKRQHRFCPSEAHKIVSIQGVLRQFLVGVFSCLDFIALWYLTKLVLQSRQQRHFCHQQRSDYTTGTTGAKGMVYTWRLSWFPLRTFRQSCHLSLVVSADKSWKLDHSLVGESMERQSRADKDLASRHSACVVLAHTESARVRSRRYFLHYVTACMCGWVQ